MLCDHPPSISAGAPMLAWRQDLFRRALWVYHHDLEEVLEIAVEELHQRLAQLGSRPARARFQGGVVVLADRQLMSQSALRQPPLLAHCPQPGRPNLHVHVLAIITRSRIFVKGVSIP